MFDHVLLIENPKQLVYAMASNACYVQQCSEALNNALVQLL